MTRMLVNATLLLLAVAAQPLNKAEFQPVAEVLRSWKEIEDANGKRKDAVKLTALVRAEGRC